MQLQIDEATKFGVTTDDGSEGVQISEDVYREIWTPEEREREDAPRSSPPTIELTKLTLLPPAHARVLSCARLPTRVRVCSCACIVCACWRACWERLLWECVLVCSRGRVVACSCARVLVCSCARVLVCSCACSCASRARACSCSCVSRACSCMCASRSREGAVVLVPHAQRLRNTHLVRTLQRPSAVTHRRPCASCWRRTWRAPSRAAPTARNHRSCATRPSRWSPRARRRARRASWRGWPPAS